MTLRQLLFSLPRELDLRFALEGTFLLQSLNASFPETPAIMRLCLRTKPRLWGLSLSSLKKVFTYKQCSYYSWLHVIATMTIQLECRNQTLQVPNKRRIVQFCINSYMGCVFKVRGEVRGETFNQQKPKILSIPLSCREAVSEHAQGDEWTPCPAIPGTITGDQSCLTL